MLQRLSGFPAVVVPGFTFKNVGEINRAFHWRYNGLTILLWINSCIEVNYNTSKLMTWSLLQVHCARASSATAPAATCPPLLVFETGASPLPVFPQATLVFLFMTPLTFSYFKQRLKHIYSFEWDIHIVIFKLLCVVENFVYVCSKLFEILWNVNSVLILFVVYSCFLQSVNNVYEFLKAASAVGSFGISDSLPSLLVSNVFSCCSFYLAKRCLLASATQ